VPSKHTIKQTHTHTQSQKTRGPKDSQFNYIQANIHLVAVVLCWFSSLQLILSMFVCVCVCVCVSLSLSLSIYIYIYIYHSCWAMEVGVGEWGNRISSTKSRQRIVLKRFKNTTSQVLTDSKLQFLWHFQFPSSWNVCRNCLSHHHHHHHHLSVLSVWQPAGGWWVNSERERERGNTKLSKWSLVVTLLPWLEFGS